MKHEWKHVCMHEMHEMNAPAESLDIAKCGNVEMWKWEILYGANTSNCHELLMPVQSGCSMNAL